MWARRGQGSGPMGGLSAQTEGLQADPWPGPKSPLLLHPSRCFNFSHCFVHSRLSKIQCTVDFPIKQTGPQNLKYTKLFRKKALPPSLPRLPPPPVSLPRGRGQVSYFPSSHVPCETNMSVYFLSSAETHHSPRWFADLSPLPSKQTSQIPS